MGPGDLVTIEFTITGQYVVKRGDYQDEEGNLFDDDTILAVERDAYDDWYGPIEVLNFATDDVAVRFDLA